MLTREPSHLRIAVAQQLCVGHPHQAVLPEAGVRGDQVGLRLRTIPRDSGPVDGVEHRGWQTVQFGQCVGVLSLQGGLLRWAEALPPGGDGLRSGTGRRERTRPGGHLC